MIEAGFKYFTQNKLYIWKKHAMKNKTETRKDADQSGNKREGLSLSGEKLSRGRLRDLAWSLDIVDLSKGKDDNE